MCIGFLIKYQRAPISVIRMINGTERVSPGRYPPMVYVHNCLWVYEQAKLINIRITNCLPDLSSHNIIHNNYYKYLKLYNVCIFFTLHVVFYFSLSILNTRKSLNI